MQLKNENNDSCIFQGVNDMTQVNIDTDNDSNKFAQKLSLNKENTRYDMGQLDSEDEC